MDAPPPSVSYADRISRLVDGLHGFLESEQAGADAAIASLISTAGEVTLSMMVAHPENKDAYLKLFNSTVEQVRVQLRREIKERKI